MEEQKTLHKPNKYIESKGHEGGGYKGGRVTKYYYNFESALGSYKVLNGTGNDFKSISHLRNHITIMSISRCSAEA